MAKEKRTFTMHPQLLFSVIQRQAGTLSKAILEGVMNGVDAKATTIDLKVSDTAVRIKDNGQGFRNRKEIEDFFEMFGTPHDASEQKVYGAFRMGRGQMFAFGRNHWRTGTFDMRVDIKGVGLDYDLEDAAKPVAGCTIDIELYETLLPSDLVTITRDLERMVRYVDVPVTLNGKQISKDPAKEKWNFETADAYIRLKPTGGLAVYNLGVFVHEISSYHFGTGGEVVAKKQLRVNFARNDVQADCPVWKRIRKVVDQNAKDANVRKPQLDEGARERLAFQWVNEPELRPELRTAPLFTDTQGRNWSVQRMQNFFGRASAGGCILTVAAAGDNRADKLMQQKRAFVLSHDTLDRFSVSNAEQLLAMLQVKERYWTPFANWSVEPFDTLARELSSNYALLPATEWKPMEKTILKLLDGSQHAWICTLPSAEGMTYQELHKMHRTFYVGISDAANAWTDGKTYVALNRDLLSRAGTTYEGLLHLAQVVVHEFTHEEASTAAHLHTPEFYQNYHDSMETVRTLANHLWQNLPKALEALGKRLTRRQLKDRDKEARATKALGTVTALAK